MNILRNSLLVISFVFLYLSLRHPLTEKFSHQREERQCLSQRLAHTAPVWFLCKTEDGLKRRCSTEKLLLLCLYKPAASCVSYVALCIFLTPDKIQTDSGKFQADTFLFFFFPL